ncbi:MAG: ABC transporter permease [Lachnospiraceae bacterium]|nr:ABC transporter permease [Lachnospiraceae bacterium]
MYRYVLKRLLMSLVVILVAAVLIFTIMNVVPGDPAAALLGDDATYEEILAKRQAMGLDGPFMVRLGQYLYKFFIKWDFGTSWFYGTPIINEVAVRLPRTVFISLINLFISLAVGIPVGIMAALKRGKWQDRGVLSLAMLFQAIPSFWLSMELILLFAVRLKWLPASGIGSWRHYILPIISGLLGGWCGNARTTRQSMLQVMRDDYITTARAKGLPEGRVIIHHMLPNALMPIITMVGGAIGGIVGGALVLERTFSIPGVGTYLLSAVNNRDYPVVETVTILLAAVNALSMLLVDLTYGFVDPRIKAQYVSSTNKGRRAVKSAKS